MPTPTLVTIPAGLEAAATQRPNVGFTFVADDGTRNTVPWSALLARTREIAQALAEFGMKKGDRVALVLPSAEEFVPTFLGVLAGGGVPVPMYPPMGLGQLTHYLDHAQHIVANSRARLLVTTGQIKAALGSIHTAAPELRPMLTYAALTGDAALWRDPGLTLDDVAFIQFTSGSTSKPKGVVLTHGNLAHNAHAIMRVGLESNEEDVGVSWLPLFHDMGLIGFVIAPILHPVPITFMSPMMFLRDPTRWLRLLHAQRGTITYAPNFAYALATKRVKDADLEGIDLSRVRVAGCGAEPIQPETLRAFHARFAKVGFRMEAFVPSYGMAESSLAIAFARGLPTDRVVGSTLWEKGEAVASTEPEGTVEVVGCGRNFPGHGLRIVHAETRAPLPERTVGEIEICGPSVTSGYFEDTERTAETLNAEGWLRTGDLGYLVDGSVYICGRRKDVIILNGRNYYPQDIEWVASRVEGVRTGNVVAFPTHRDGLGREAIVVVAEAKSAGGHDMLAVAVRSEVQRGVGVVVDEVVIAEAGTIPKTSSGKVQRAKARALYEAGELRKREGAGKAEIARRLAESGIAHLRLGIFGTRK